MSINLTKRIASLSAIAIVAATLTLGSAGVAGATPPPWEPDPGSSGGLTFFDANGLEIIGGSTSAAPIASYVEGDSTVQSGDNRATLFGYTPVSGEAPGAWSGEALSSSTAYPNADAPNGLNDATLPLVTGAGSDESLAQYASNFPNSDTTSDGYAGLYVLRIKTVQSGHQTALGYDASDVQVADGQWTLVYPVPTPLPTSTGLEVTTPGPAEAGATVDLQATVSPAVPGTVQFTSNGHDVGSPVADTANGIVTLATAALAPGSDDLSATFTPNSDYNYTGSSGGTTYSVDSTSIPQTAPTAATIGAGRGYSGQLEGTDPYGAIAYTTTTPNASLTVSPTGAITASTTVPPGSYTASGTDDDAFGDTGTWSFTLTVTAIALHQSGATTASVAAGHRYAGTALSVPDAFGTPTFTTTSATKLSGTAVLTVSSSGALTETLGAATRPGTYHISGTASDTFGDSGTWSFTLTLDAATALVIAQISLPAATATQHYSATFVAFGGSRYTWSLKSGALPAGLHLSTAGVLSGTPTRASAGTHTFSVKVKSGSKTATASFTLTVNRA